MYRMWLQISKVVSTEELIWNWGQKKGQRPRPQEAQTLCESNRSGGVPCRPTWVAY